MSSDQTEPASQLPAVVLKHLNSPWKRPLAEHTVFAWSKIQAIIKEAPDRPLVLDSGCGTGTSAWGIAERHPACWVIAVDQSAHRLHLDEGIRRSDRILWVRAELGDLWRLMARARTQLSAHYLLYPNPWPKKTHLQRRWHGHPAFPDMVRLGGYLEARSNWPIYLEELSLAVRIATGATAAPKRYQPHTTALSLFEKKYVESRHPLYRLQLCLKPLACDE